jgi:hypothetical protein
MPPFEVTVAVGRNTRPQDLRFWIPNSKPTPYTLHPIPTRTDAAIWSPSRSGALPAAAAVESTEGNILGFDVYGVGFRDQRQKFRIWSLGYGI